MFRIVIRVRFGTSSSTSGSTSTSTSSYAEKGTEKEAEKEKEKMIGVGDCCMLEFYSFKFKCTINNIRRLP